MSYPKTIHISFGGPIYFMPVKGKMRPFEMHSYFGPIPVHAKTHDPIEKVPASFWSSYELWDQGGRQMDGDKCVLPTPCGICGGTLLSHPPASLLSTFEQLYTDTMAYDETLEQRWRSKVQVAVNPAITRILPRPLRPEVTGGIACGLVELAITTLAARIGVNLDEIEGDTVVLEMADRIVRDIDSELRILQRGSN